MPIEIAPRITVDPGIRSGKPVIQGTRAPVELVLAKLAGGMSVEDIVREYEIAPEDVRAVLAYAAKMMAAEEIRATG